jgi:hypothetical protein
MSHLIWSVLSSPMTLAPNLITVHMFNYVHEYTLPVVMLQESVTRLSGHLVKLNSVSVIAHCCPTAFCMKDWPHSVLETWAVTS